MTDASTHSVSIDRARPWLAGLLLGLILFSGFFIRFDSLFHWLEHKERYFFDQQSTPLTLTVDAYYYLDIAKQLNAGTYQSRDPRRKAPQGLKRNPTPPLISVLLAGLAGISSLSLEMIAIMLPALWGALIGIPAYLLAEHLFRRPTDQNQARWLSASQAAGLLAAAVTLLAPKLVLRTSIGWFDTDGLNLLFSLMAAYLALRLLDSRSRRELLLWFTAGAANLLLFLWNWDQSPVGALALGATPFGLALLLTAWRRPRFLQALIIPGMAVLGILIWWKGLDIINPARHLHILGNYLDYFTNQVAETSPFPTRDATYRSRPAPNSARSPWTWPDICGSGGPPWAACWRCSGSAGAAACCYCLCCWSRYWLSKRNALSCSCHRWSAWAWAPCSICFGGSACQSG